MYSIDTYKTPFWAENGGFTRGRDPLGIQNSSITLYGRLLPGMTNLTLRVRYYGFYCWILYEYDRLPNRKDWKTLTQHYNFIRRGELLIGYIMAHTSSEQLSIIGSDFVGNHLNEIDNIGYYDIGAGADKFKNTPKGSVYWDYSSGALGQYYAGSLINLGLIEVVDKFFHIKDDGIKLAKAYMQSISENSRKLFLEYLEKGKIDLDGIIKLEEFGIHKISISSAEWNFYRQLLLRDDGEYFKTSDDKVASKRKQTIFLYLNYCKNNTPEQSFQVYRYDVFENHNSIDNSTFGWYYFFLIETYHYALETIFWAMLNELDGRIISVADFIESIIKIIQKNIRKYFKFDQEESLSKIISSLQKRDLVRELSSLEQLTKAKQNSQKALGMAVLLIIQTYLNIQENLESISKFEDLNYLKGQKGNITEVTEQYINKYKQCDIQNYLESIIKTIINDHISTAFRKMGNGESNRLKFIIEDNLISHVETMEPKHTNPRIKTLHNFMTDLGFIDQKQKVTRDGQVLIDEIALKND